MLIEKTKGNEGKWKQHYDNCNRKGWFISEDNWYLKEKYKVLLVLWTKKMKRMRS